MNKAEVLKAMNTIVRALNDEGAYYRRWITLIPDEADDEELEDIANNQEDIFEDAVLRFGRIMKQYSKSGLYVDKKCYDLEKES